MKSFSLILKQVVLGVLVIVFDIWWVMKILQFDQDERMLPCFLTGLLGYGIIHTVIIKLMFTNEQNGMKSNLYRHLFSYYVWVGSSLMISSIGQLSFLNLSAVYLIVGLSLITGAVLLMLDSPYQLKVSMILNVVLTIFFLFEVLRYIFLYSDSPSLILVPFIIFNCAFLYSIGKEINSKLFKRNI